LQAEVSPRASRIFLVLDLLMLFECLAQMALGGCAPPCIQNQSETWSVAGEAVTQVTARVGRAADDAAAAPLLLLHIVHA
jgi:hypothetical protein